MRPEIFALIVAAVIFGGGVCGLALQRILHEKHTTGPTRDMIGAVVGLLTLLCALVTGLLVWTAYGVYAKSEHSNPDPCIQGVGAGSGLADYGP